MTDAEARCVANAIRVADGECYICVGDICDELLDALPDIDWYGLVNEMAERPGWISADRS